MNVLELDDVSVRYGSVRALDGAHVKVRDKTIVALLGANGAGKSTTIRAITGMVRYTGTISFRGRRLDGLTTEETVRQGIVQVPEGRGTLARLTVEENLLVGGYTIRSAATLHRELERPYSYFPILFQRRRQRAGSLSGGEQQALAIGRALMSRPQTLLVDELSLGLAPQVVESIVRVLTMLNEKEGLSILLVEQNAALALRIATYAYILNLGRVVAEGPSREMLHNDAVRASYLGY